MSRGTFPNLIKNIYKNNQSNKQTKNTANSILNAEKIDAFSLRLDIR